jgi:hypothetical protein
MRKKFPLLSSLWVRISECHPDDPNSYLLEACGNSSALNILLKFTNQFVITKIESVNLHRLMWDTHTLVVEVEVGKSDLGFFCGRIKESKSPGVWIRKVEPDKKFARAMGGIKVLQSGCAIFGIDGIMIYEPDDVSRILTNARHDKNKKTVVLNICLSKYSNLDRLPNALMRGILRRDGVPYDPAFYRGVKIKQHLAESCWSKRACRSTLLLETNEHLTDDMQCLPTDSSNDKGEETQRKQRNSANHFSMFEKFVEKFRPLVCLDFKDLKINEKSICSSIWAQHKRYFGSEAECGGCCECILALPELTSTVISDIATKHKAKHSLIESETELHNLTCGVMANFAPRFIGLLRQEYPSENATELIGRLVEMWSFHQRNPLYGVRCTTDCSCIDEWDQLFGRGDVSTAEAFQKKYSRRISQRSSLKSQISLAPGQRENLLPSHVAKLGTALGKRSSPNASSETFAPFDPFPLHKRQRLSNAGATGHHSPRTGRIPRKRDI